MSILKPGMRCIIIGEERGCEANIGATLTITQLDPRAEPNRPVRWLFKDASRPLAVLTRFKSIEYVTHSHGLIRDDGTLRGLCRIQARYLVPIKGDELDSEPPKAERDLPKDPATLAWARSVVQKTLTA